VGASVEPDVLDLYIDDVNTAKMAAHGIKPRQVFAVLDTPYVLYRNRSEQSAPYMLVGLDDNGQCIAMPIWPTREDSTLWRPVTAWYCKASEWARLRQDRRRR
jgi:hypothetical protein